MKQLLNVYISPISQNTGKTIFLITTMTTHKIAAKSRLPIKRFHGFQI